MDTANHGDQYGYWSFAVTSLPTVRPVASGCATSGTVEWDVQVAATWAPPADRPNCPRTDADVGPIVLTGVAELERVWKYGSARAFTHGRLGADSRRAPPP